MDTTEILQLIRELRQMGAVAVDVGGSEDGASVRVRFLGEPLEATPASLPVEVPPMNPGPTSPALWGRLGTPPRFHPGRVVPAVTAEVPDE